MENPRTQYSDHLYAHTASVAISPLRILKPICDSTDNYENAADLQRPSRHNRWRDWNADRCRTRTAAAVRRPSQHCRNLTAIFYILHPRKTWNSWFVKLRPAFLTFGRLTSTPASESKPHCRNLRPSSNIYSSRLKQRSRTHWLCCRSSMEMSTPFSWRRAAVYFCDTCLLFLVLLSPGFFDNLRGWREKRKAYNTTNGLLISLTCQTWIFLLVMKNGICLQWEICNLRPCRVRL